MGGGKKVAFGAGAGVLLALVAGLVVSTWFFIEEKVARRRAVAAEQEQARSRQRAEASEKQARTINRFLTKDVLGQATPEQNAREKNVTIIEALNEATRRLDQNPEYRQQPELEATLRLAVGTTYFDMGLLSEAERNLRAAVRLRRSALGPTNLDTLVAQHCLAKLLLWQRNLEEGGRLIRETWQDRLRLLGAEDRATLDSQQLYGGILLNAGQLQEAETIARQILQIRERARGPDDYDTIDALGTLGQILGTRGAFPEAEHDLREALTRFQRIGYGDKQDGLLCVKELAVLRLQQGNPTEAVKMLVDLRPRAITIFGPDHNLTLHIQRLLVR